MYQHILFVAIDKASHSHSNHTSHQEGSMIKATLQRKSWLHKALLRGKGGKPFQLKPYFWLELGVATLHRVAPEMMAAMMRMMTLRRELHVPVWMSIAGSFKNNWMIPSKSTTITL